MVIPENEEPLAGLEKAIRELEITIEPWTQQKESKFGPKPFVRPFICDGPLTSCDVFIVGINPRENIEFQKFWKCGKYDKVAWQKEYLLQGYKGTITDIIAGRKPRAIASATRKKIEVFCHTVASARVLETNLYPVATKKAKELDNHPGKDTSIIRLLLEGLQPRVVIAHGDPSVAFLSQFLAAGEIANGTDPATPFTRFRPKNWPHDTNLRALPQLGRTVSYKFMIGLGSHVRDVLLNGRF